jgi:hypothetical protein
MNRCRRKIAALLVAGEAVAAVAVVLAAASLAAPRVVEAQAPPCPLPCPTAIVANPAYNEAKAVEDAKKKLMDSASYAITNAVLSAANTMAQRIAANTATWAASGFKGQAPLAYVTEWNSWHNNVIMDSVSDSLNLLSTKYAGFGLCQPLNLQVSLRIKLGIARLYAPKPSCSFNAFWNNVLQTKSNISSGEFLRGISANFEMGQSSLSVALNTPYAVVNQATNKYLDYAAQRATSPFKPLTDYITGNVKTPAQIIEHAVELTTIDNPNNTDRDMIVATINKSDLLASIGANAAKIFTSNLTQKVLEKYLKGGMLNGKEEFCKSSIGRDFNLCKGIVNEKLASGTSSGSPGVELASAYFSSIFSPNPLTIDDYSPIPEMSSCPSGTARGIWNCVIDQSFVSALSGKETGFLSVREAVKPESGSLLHGNWQLVPPSDSRNNDSDCYTRAYCYNNLVKLRRMRIIPVGWEMAALASARQNESITLQAAMDAFSDQRSPYYHLVDPDWILKVPVTQCRQQVNGQTLVAADTGERAKVCVDSPSCISEDADGKCSGGYGYCTREHTVWQIDAQSCPSQFASCANFADPKGKELTALTNTLDASFCSAQNAGCKPFATEKGSSGWTNSSPLAFLASSAPACDASSAGCRSLRQMKNASTANLFPNPGLEDTNANGSQPASWTGLGGAFVRDGQSSFEGLASYHITPATGLSLGGYYGNVAAYRAGRPQDYIDIRVEPKTLYTLSFYTRGDAPGSVGRLLMKTFDTQFYGQVHLCPDGHSFPSCMQDMTNDVSYVPTCTSTGNVAPSCTISSTYEFGASTRNSAFFLDFSPSPSYERFTITFATSSNTHYLGFVWSLEAGSGYYLDAFQLEKGVTATAFHSGGTDTNGNLVNIKAPPDYLGCTGEPESDAGKGCGNYARVCRQSEVGCDSFVPSSGGPEITAVTSSNDACPAECISYDTFRQERTVWEQARFPLHFIPSTAASCKLSEVGCDEFTNLELAAAGGEARSYFTYVRACRQPDAANDGTYFTWEGSDVAGYQLKSYTLRSVPGNDDTMFSVPNTEGVYFRQRTSAAAAGPAYLTGTDAASCTVSVYRPEDGSASLNPDCREFIDADGNVFYRLLSATIASTADCKTFRKTASTTEDCASSGGVWNEAGHACEYFVHEKESKTCRAAANGCRAFVGNHGDNSFGVFSSDFENANTDRWTGGTISNESTVVGGHSYAAASLARPLADESGNPSLHQGSLYTLTFWAKGTGSISAVLDMSGDVPAGRNIFADPAGIVTPRYALSTDWQRYVLGPVSIDWATAASDRLLLDASGGTGYFDNIAFDETQDRFALVKDSWRTPASCDKTSAGQPLAQAQLGCRAYQNGTGTEVNLKSFDRLCRQTSIGCEALADNQLTDTPYASYRNVKCVLTAGGAVAHGPCLVAGKTVCTVPDTEESCRFDFDGLANVQLLDYAANGIVYSFNYSLPDVFVIPPDTTRYLVNDGSKSCDAASVGCTELGDTNVSGTALCTLGAEPFVRPCSVGGVVQCYVAAGQSSCTYRQPFNVNGASAYKLINPDKLQGQLCTAEASGCQSWTNGRGETVYFKDPGEAACEYVDSTTLNGSKVSGWFKKGTQEPCDPRYARGGTAFGIRKNGDPEFVPGKFAGLCKTDYAGCTEFTDHSDLGADGTEFPQGRPYYYIKDSKIDAAVSACGNQVSKKQGCLALDETSNPNKTIDTIATYMASERAAFGLVSPVDGTTLAADSAPPGPRPNDANIIMKVKRDRVCTEWLECNSDQMVSDSQTGRDTTRCLSLGSCLEKGADGRCIRWGSMNAGYPVLDTALYASRDVTASGSDYSGFSIPTKPPVYAFRQPSAQAPYQLNVNGTMTNQTCKAYPESDSPFPKNVLTDSAAATTTSRKGGYSNAGVCELAASTATSGKDCECSYRKVAYGSAIVKYFPTNAESGIKADGTQGEIKNAICAGGPFDGQECVVLASGNRTATNLTCANGTTGGTCESFEKIDSVLGQKGYCLESDSGLAINGGADSACITWLPIDSPKGLDTANQFTSAAFIPKVGQERYCAAPAKYCVARDCLSGPKQLTLCTALKNTTVAYSPALVGQSNGNCFDACNYDGTGDFNAACVGAEGACVDLVHKYCADFGYYRFPDDKFPSQTESCLSSCTTSACRVACRDLDGRSAGQCQTEIMSNGSCRRVDPVSGAVTFDDGDVNCTDRLNDCVTGQRTMHCLSAVQADPSCSGFAGPNSNNPYCTDLYAACNQTTGEAYELCKNMETNQCEDLGNRDMYGRNPLCSHDLQGISGAAAFANYSRVPYFNVSAYCGVDGFTRNGNQAIPSRRGGYDLSSCASGGTQFCGEAADPVFACPVGQSCVAMNDLTVHQTEYTREETTESYGRWTLIPTQAGQVPQYHSIFGYPTMPTDGSHSAFGSVNEATIPTVSSPSLRFSLDKAEGDWINIYNETLALNNNPADALARQQNSRNFSSETNNQSPIIGSYPLDLVGLYYFGRTAGSGSASVTYKLDSPSLLLASQIDRVIVKVLSNGQNGLCRYNTGEDLVGTWMGVQYDVCSKSIFGDTANGANGWYGYNPWYGAGSRSGDDQNFTISGWASYVALTAANDWSSQLSSDSGSLTLSLQISDTEPRRVTGITVDLNDISGSGYDYIAGLDVHLRGPVCGEAAYIGSSNPTAETNTPVAFTNSVNGLLRDFAQRNLSGGGFDSDCNPWGAYASTNPLTVVTSSALSTACELAKSAIYAGREELRRIFALVPSVGRFLDAMSSVTDRAPFYSYLGDNRLQRLSPTWDDRQVAADGSVSGLTINGIGSGSVFGRGSLRADLKFYARADSDQMPIRSVRVGWNDPASDNVDPGAFNYYKNHDSGCSDGASEFGLTSGACENKPFAYSHVYSGDCASPAAAPAGGYPQIGVLAGQPVCVYHPTVSIIDNWGHTTSAPSAPTVIVAP